MRISNRSPHTATQKGRNLAKVDGPLSISLLAYGFSG